MKELLKRAGLVLLLLAAVRGILAGWAAAPSVPEDYTGSVATGGPVEAAYLAMGSYEVACTTAAAPQEEWGDLVMYYPCRAAPEPVPLPGGGDGQRHGGGSLQISQSV